MSNNEKWQVLIPDNRRMMGVHTFDTMKDAEEFIDHWNQIEESSGNGRLVFYFSGQSEFSHTREGNCGRYRNGAS